MPFKKNVSTIPNNIFILIERSQNYYFVNSDYNILYINSARTLIVYLFKYDF